MVGLFGISTVVVGFGLVVWKIMHNRDFAWLIQRQLWALAGAAYLFVLTPVDVIVHSYNVRQVLAGDLAPAVQISVHPISAEGYLVLQPLTHCEDAIIRAARFAVAGAKDPKIVEAITKEKQKFDPDPANLRPFEFAWITAYLSQVDDPAIKAFAQNFGELSNSKLGGKQSLVWN